MIKCNWCGGEFEASIRGNQTKTHCSDQCRLDRHKAARLFGLALEDGDFVNLKAWYDAYLRGTENERD